MELSLSERLSKLRREKSSVSESLRHAAAVEDWDEFDTLAAGGLEDGSDGPERAEDEPGGGGSPPSGEG